MAEKRVQRRLAAILAADVADYPLGWTGRAMTGGSITHTTR